MKNYFKKITALATSALMVGMTMGAAAAANYPAPFVSGGSADVAIVYGTGSGVSQLDLVHAANIQDSLSGFVSGGSAATSASTSGEVVSLDTSATRIWLNTSLNTAKSQLTKTDLPSVLADYSFSGDVTSKVTSTLKFFAGATAGGDNSGKVIFARQPSSSDDPAVGISLGTSATSNPLYNATATMSAINFTNADSEGEEITLFGQSFTIASETDLTELVLLKEAEKVDLTSDSPTATVTVGGASYTIELVSASDTSATVKVTDSAGNSASKEINEAASKRISGLDVAVTNADETNLKLSASVIVGSQKVTLANGATVTIGEDDDPVDGTYAYIVGGIGATTEITISVFRADSSSDAILAGESFVDPVFGSFKVDFAGLSSNLDDTGRATISVHNAGDEDMEVALTDDSGNAKTFNFAHNESGQWRLASNDNYSIAVREMANLSMGTGKAKYIVVGNEDYGHLLELYDVYNQTAGSSSVTNDRVKFRDVVTGDTYETTFTSTEGSGSVDVDGKRYTVTFTGTGEDAWVQVRYPTSDSADAGTFVFYPTIETQGGALVSLYEPRNVSIARVNGSSTDYGVATLRFPDGDGYTNVVFTYLGGTNWTMSGASTSGLFNANLTTNYTVATIGAVRYNFTAGMADNFTKVYMIDPESNANIDNPALVVFEGKDDNTEYHAIVVDLETAPAGTSDSGVGVNDVLFSSDYYHASATLASDSDITQDIDWFGTLVTTDASESDQKTATISYPLTQVYTQLFVGESGSVVTPGSGGSSGGGSLGNVLVADSAVSSVSTKNLIVVGGSCINSAAASLVGGAYCGAAWTSATGAGAGQFLIKGFADSSLTSKMALLVAGYEAADTVNAATYLRTKAVDTGKEYKGTSATEATLVTTSA